MPMTNMKNTNPNKFFLALLFLGSFVSSVFLITAEKGKTSVQEEFVINEPAPRTVFSPINLTFVDEKETERLREEKQAAVLPVYVLDPKVQPAALAGAEERIKRLFPKEGEGKEKAKSLEDLSRLLTLLLERSMGGGILEDAHKRQAMDGGTVRVRQLHPESKEEGEVLIKDLAGLAEAKETAAAFLEKEEIKDREIRNQAFEIFSQVAEPNLFFDETRTRERMKRAADSVAPILESVKRGEMIIQKGTLVTARQQKRLAQIQKKMAAKEARHRLLAVSLLVLLGLALVFLYLRQFEPKHLDLLRYPGLILTALLLTLALERASLFLPNASSYLLPGALASVLLAILWRPAAGILGALAISIISLPLAEFRLEIFLMILLGSLIGSFAARRVRKRLHFLRLGMAMGLTNGIVLFAFFSYQEWKFTEALSFSALGLANGFVVTALAFFLVPLFEHLFNLTTDITLLELSDLNHPLLKRMVVEAPGTYHHSLVVSTLAEAACEAIGANALLARVGSYFHDIGKIARSEYFTENQQSQGVSEPHVRLSPAMSCRVIMDHVRDGVELAHKHRLKEVIVRFIPEHQGTGVIYFFYKKALDQAAPGEKVNSEDFRYAGPKPQSRETAVAMLADSTEATSRSLKEITPASIRNLVRKVINEKFIDGQLDECDLTLRDLFRIQESFVHNLMAIFHTRVTYPVKPTDPNRPDLFESDQFRKFHED